MELKELGMQELNMIFGTEEYNRPKTSPIYKKLGFFHFPFDRFQYICTSCYCLSSFPVLFLVYVTICLMFIAQYIPGRDFKSFF